MSAIKDGRFPITLDKERHLLFSLNVIDEMQDKFGGFDKLDKALSGKDSVKNLRWLLTLAFSLGNNGTEEPTARDDEEEEDDEIRKNAAAGKE